jgi:cytochrome c-type biogenesis protein CcmF
VPADGNDLNPLLQDPGLIIHPPLLYMGYVGFSVAFAFAVAALLGGRLDAAWARWSRPWTNVAWAFLSLGIMLGSWWAYYELGWGGWWFWDPVENASFMPWLAGTALLHSLAVTEKRGLFKSWTVLLAIFAFSLSLLGTFLVRSGVLTSVHAFAADPARGLFILVFLAIVVGGSLTLYALRAPRCAAASASPGVARVAAAGQQRGLPGGHADGAVRHPVSRCSWMRWARASTPSARRISTPCSCP